MTQRERILEMLEAAGEIGCFNIDFIRKRILRYSARIFELRKEGYRISRSKKYPSGLVRYTLIE